MLLGKPQIVTGRETLAARVCWC